MSNERRTAGVSDACSPSMSLSLCFSVSLSLSFSLWLSVSLYIYLYLRVCLLSLSPSPALSPSMPLACETWKKAPNIQLPPNNDTSILSFLLGQPQVRLNCATSPGKMVVPMKKIGIDFDESIGVVEFRTVALGGEILLEAEGM